MVSLKAKEQIFLQPQNCIHYLSYEPWNCSGWKGLHKLSYPTTQAMPSTPTPVMSLPRRKGRLRLCLRTSGDGSLLLFEATSSPFTALTLIFVIYSLFATSCGLSAKSFISISFNPHHSTRNAIIPILQFRKLREINYLPKIPQLESGGGGSEWTAAYLAVTPCSFFFFLSSPYTCPPPLASTHWSYFCLFGAEREKPKLVSTWALFSYFKIFIWCPFHSRLKLS